VGEYLALSTQGPTIHSSSSLLMEKKQSSHFYYIPAPIRGVSVSVAVCAAAALVAAKNICFVLLRTQLLFSSSSK
jgi:hypothetical protein